MMKADRHNLLSQSLKQSLIIFLMLIALNFGAAVVMQMVGLREDISDFNNTSSIFLGIAFFYWLTCQIHKWKFRYWFIPAFRIVFWSFVVIIGFLCENRMNTEDFLYANNGFFLWWELLKLKGSTLRSLSEGMELALEDILLIGCVEFVLIQIANIIFPLTNEKSEINTYA